MRSAPFAWRAPSGRWPVLLLRASARRLLRSSMSPGNLGFRAGEVGDGLDAAAVLPLIRGVQSLGPDVRISASSRPASRFSGAAIPGSKVQCPEALTIDNCAPDQASASAWA